MIRYKLERVYLPTETLGSIYSPNGELVAKSMELPWKNNDHNVSCIPEGIYTVRKNAPKPTRDYGYFRFDNVPNRNGILMHKITYVKDLKGCIGIGSRFEDLNKDGVPDMVESGKKLQWMYENLPEVFELEITKKP